jgi:hypothetical protein
MAKYLAIGKSIVKEEDYFNTLGLEDILKLKKSVRSKPDYTISIGRQDVSVKDILQPTKIDGTPFEPIEIGKPLTIEIRWVYTGEKPSKHGHGMIITSAFKSLATFNEAPRAVNLIRKKVRQYSNIKWNAPDKGTPLSFYTPAMLEPTMFATFELAFDSFPDEIINSIGDAVTKAAGIPIFAAQSLYLIAGGSLLKLISKFGHMLFDGKDVFKFSNDITFARPGSIPVRSGWMLLTQETTEDYDLKNLQFGPDGQLIKSDGRPYDGEFPYIVISLDGREVDAYKQFTPTAASAVLLDKFFGVQEGQTAAVDAAIEGLKLYSDYQFRQRAEKVQKDLGKIKLDDPKYAEKQKELEALKANIINDVFKLE